jgi:hypothetical protein
MAVAVFSNNFLRPGSLSAISSETQNSTLAQDTSILHSSQPSWSLHSAVETSVQEGWAIVWASNSDPMATRKSNDRIVLML